MLPFLQFVSVAKVACVAEAGNDVLVLVQSCVDACAPDGGLVARERVLDVLDALWSCQDACHMDMLRIALGEKSLHAHLHADACGEHGICDDEGLASEVGGG